LMLPSLFSRASIAPHAHIYTRNNATTERARGVV